MGVVHADIDAHGDAESVDEVEDRQTVHVDVHALPPPPIHKEEDEDEEVAEEGHDEHTVVHQLLQPRHTDCYYIVKFLLSLHAKQ